jgi:hypothetical protein
MSSAPGATIPCKLPTGAFALRQDTASVDKEPTDPAQHPRLPRRVGHAADMAAGERKARQGVGIRLVDSLLCIAGRRAVLKRPSHDP